MAIHQRYDLLMNFHETKKNTHSHTQQIEWHHNVKQSKSGREKKNKNIQNNCIIGIALSKWSNYVFFLQ